MVWRYVRRKTRVAFVFIGFTGGLEGIFRLEKYGTKAPYSEAKITKFGETAKMAQDKIENTQRQPNQEVTVAELVKDVQNHDSVNSIVKGHRPSVAEDIELQVDYMNIHFLRIGSGLTIAETAKVKGISIGKVKRASEWVQDTFVSVAPAQYFADAEVLLNGRIKELALQIAETQKGEPAFNRLTHALIMIDGKIHHRVDKRHLRYLWTRRESYEKTLLSVRGLLHTAQFVQAKNVFTGDVTVMQKNVAIINNMNAEDRAKFLEILDKYGKPPSCE